MKIIFLNTWQGKRRRAFEKFIKKHSSDTSIFCFSEVTSSLYQHLLSNLLTPFNAYFSLDKTLKNSVNSQVIFIDKEIKVQRYKKILLYDCWNRIEVPGFFQSISFKFTGKDFIVGNLQGMAYPGDKLDNDKRINQTRTTLNLLEDSKGSKIFGGDFNLLSETESIKMFEEAGYKNLIKDFKISNTRNHFAWEQAQEQLESDGLPYFGKQYFSDYVFVSPEIKVKSFSVPDIKISDHLPLILDFEI